MVDDSNVLLGFTIPTTTGAVNAGTYSTGVNDALLTTNSVAYTAANFEAFKPPASILTSGGLNYFGVTRRWLGRTTDRLTTENTDTPLDAAWYLTSPGLYTGPGAADHGLELGTNVFNLPAQTLKFPVTLNNPSAIGDGVPDIVGTQMGQVGNSDSYWFVDSAGTVVGNAVTISYGTTPAVGSETWALYDRTGAPSNIPNWGPRDIHMTAFELADFGITAANYTQVAGFVQQLNGNSDVAFVAYNTDVLKVLTNDLDLNVTVNASSTAAVCAGDTVDLSVTVSNLSTTGAGNVKVQVQLPPGYGSLSGITPSQGTFDATTGIWTVGSLAGPASATLTFNAVASAQTGSFTATIDSQDGIDADNTNNSAAVRLTRGAACPVIQTSAPIPTLGEMVLLLLLAALLGVSAVAVHRRGR